MSSLIDFTAGLLPVTKRGFMYQIAAKDIGSPYNIRVSAFLKPKTHGGKSPFGCSLYFNAHPVGVDPSKKNTVGSPVQVYCGRDGVLKSSAGDRRPAAVCACSLLTRRWSPRIGRRTCGSTRDA